MNWGLMGRDGAGWGGLRLSAAGCGGVRRGAAGRAFGAETSHDDLFMAPSPLPSFQTSQFVEHVDMSGLVEEGMAEVGRDAKWGAARKREGRGRGGGVEGNIARSPHHHPPPTTPHAQTSIVRGETS